MTLSIDVDSTGLVPNAEYDGVPPTVNSVFSDGRWGFRTTDSTGVAFPQYELAHVFFGQSAFTLGFSFNAADGPGSAGEFFRIHQSLFLRIEADGALRLDFISNADIRHTFTSQPTSALDGDWHDILISYDGTTGELRLDLDGTQAVSGTASGDTKPPEHWGLNFGGIWNVTGFDGLIDHIYVNDSWTASSDNGTAVSSGSTVILDFAAGSEPGGLTLVGDAHVSAGETLALDGNGDYAVLTGPMDWENAHRFSASLDFRFDGGNTLDYARAIHAGGALSLDVKDDALNLAVETETGTHRAFIGSLGFDDLQWHTVTIDIDTQSDEFILSLDGQVLLDESGLGLLLPADIPAVTLGGMPWGRGFSGEIDNVSIGAENHPEIGPALGLADPAVSSNTNGYLQWGVSSKATFIDRMKGAHEWTGKFATHTASNGSIVVFNDTGIFSGQGNVVDIVFDDTTLLEINRLLAKATYGQGLISVSQYFAIMNDVNSYFKIEVGSSGKSKLYGRLDANDPFALMARFDRDIGKDLDALRAANQAYVAIHDRNATYRDLTLDENGWPVAPPLDIAGGEGEASAIVLWYPAEAANAPNSIYAGNFYLIADGEGTIDLEQNGSGSGLLNLQGIQIDGPTVVPFAYTPNGSFARLTITSTDPNGSGEYLRDIKIIHENHLPLYEAGEIFTPEFVALHEDHRVVRWMQAQEATDTHAYAEGTFADANSYDFYSFNLGTGVTETNGFPIDAIIGFSNKTGTDPWISVPINASDAYVQGLAAYVAQQLDPRLKVHVELGNENWNGVFETHAYATQAGLARWGELQLQMNSQGQFVRDSGGNLIIQQHGAFFSESAADANGYASLDALAVELGLGYTLYPQEDAWGEWASMRATQIAKIFENVFAANDPITAGDRVHNVMATFTTNSKASEILLDGALWQEAEPGTSIDPATVFESLAIGAYFGGSTGARDSDLVSHWIDTLGSEQAMDLLLRHLKAGTDPGIDLIKFGADLIQPNGEVDPAKIVTGVPYDSALAIDLWDAIFFNNATVRSDVQNGAGVATGAELVFGADVHHYARVVTAPSGNTAVQLRVDPDHGAFESVLEFDGAVNKTLEQLIAEGTLFVRSVESLADSAEARFQPQKTVADQYGLDLIAYEGGQSFSAAIWGVFANNLNNQPLIDLLADLNDSPEMTELYDLWYAAWQSAGGGSLTHYSDYGLPGATGSWGQIDYLGQQHAAGASTPKYDFLEAFQNSASPWWQEMRDPGTFLQGRTNSGTAGDDTLVGTPEEDVIFGGEGNDWIIAGPGADALSGGLGINTVDGGDGDDLIILTSTVDVIDAGKGVDAVKFAHGLNALDLSALNATGVEVLDLRNDAHSTLRVTDQDLFDFTPARALTVYAETADTLELTGFDHQATTAVGAGAARHYQGTVAGETVGLTVITDIAAQPDVLLLP